MHERRIVTWDGNEATASVAHRINEVISIYPITPASPMGEHADAWTAKGQKNIWGDVPSVIEMQSEAGAAGAVHGALQAGALTTTFTASQGLLLMLPNMYKIAGELTASVIHIAARTVATHALSIFGDHSDIYSARGTGFAMLGSASVQEAHDFALISQVASLKSRVPFLHFFEGFRVSHEIAKGEMLSDDDLRAMMPQDLVDAHRKRAMSPDHPVLRGTAQNPDVFFQAREACNPFYDQCAAITQQVMDDFAELTGRQYGLFEYVGAPDADKVIVLMGCGAETVHETVEYLNTHGEKVGMIKVRLFRPFSIDLLIDVLPKTVQKIAVLDRTKEPGAAGEPLYLDVVNAVFTAVQSGKMASLPMIVGGRYGLSSKEFTPAMVKGVYENLDADQPKNAFTVGIVDDITGLSLPWDPSFNTDDPELFTGVFYGLGADGTVGANKNSIKIIGTETDFHAQGYFVYDSKKSGAVTVSHLRFGPKQIRSPYLITQAKFVGCHQYVFLDKYDVLDFAAPGATFLLNAPFGPDEVWSHLPANVQQAIIDKDLKFYVIDAYKVAREAGMGMRINTIMQTCFFAISGVLPRDEAIARIKGAIQKTYGKKGDEIVRRNNAAVDASVANLHQVTTFGEVDGHARPPFVPEAAPEIVHDVIGKIGAGYGETLPVSAFTPDGTWPTATTQWEKRTIAQEIPIWDPSICIQCNKCALVCPHGAIRAKVYPEEALEGCPETFRHVAFKGKAFRSQPYTVQVAPEDCTGCGLCVNVCPSKDKSNPRHKAIDMAYIGDHLEVERENYSFFLSLPKVDRSLLKHNTVKDSQFLEPLFEYSGACAGCGETPYVKVVSQLFGDRMIIANATGCSSIYGGNLPTTPYCVDDSGRGPTWSNSLFEDNAEFGFGMHLAIEQNRAQAQRLLTQVGASEQLITKLLAQDQRLEAGITAQRDLVVELRKHLAAVDSVAARQLELLADYLVRKSVWIFGGDGWAYDIGYGGLDHVFAMGRDVNILVMDTEVYSNTGGQASKATPTGAVAKFAAAGRPLAKKDLGMMAMAYGNVYVAQIAMGAKDSQTVKAIAEAEAYEGTSLIMAYSHCINHGYSMANGLDQQQRAVACGHWPLYRYNPALKDQGKNPLQLDSKAPSMPLSEYIYNETRFAMLRKADPERAAMLLAHGQAVVDARWAQYEALANNK